MSGHPTGETSGEQRTAVIIIIKKLKLDGCIVWNAHNTVFGRKRSAICAHVVYFLHSTRPCVTRLNSRW